MLETLLPYLLVALPYVITLTAVVLATVLPVLGVKYMRLLAARFDYEMSFDEKHRVEQAITAAVREAEEWAHGKVVAGDEKPLGVQKLAHAVEFLARELERLGVTAWARESLEGWIRARLNRERDAAETATVE